MRIIIYDDDIIFADKLQKEIGSFFAQRSLALPEFVTYHTGEQLLEDTGSKDLIFLDRELPGIDGILVGAPARRSWWKQRTMAFSRWLWRILFFWKPTTIW